jgi:hypothetical protein
LSFTVQRSSAANEARLIFCSHEGIVFGNENPCHGIVALYRGRRFLGANTFLAGRYRSPKERRWA